LRETLFQSVDETSNAVLDEGGVDQQAKAFVGQLSIAVSVTAGFL